MSIDGKRSTQGDEYQLRVALHWLIRLLNDDSIHGIQVNSTGVTGQNFLVSVDDVVVLYKDGSACFIQAKKNQTDYKAWTLSDKTLKEELQKARDQLESHTNAEVCFYSRSPFGELKALVENCNNFPDYSAFQRDKNQKQIGALKKFATIIQRSEELTFNLTRRITFGATHEFEDWDRLNLEALDRIVPRAETVKDILERYLSKHEASLKSSTYIITRQDILDELNRHDISPTPKRTESEILAAFKSASRIGRSSCLCTIDGKKIPRAELSRLLELIQQGSQTILLTDRAGSGKTCLLLDLADELEKIDSACGLLFIKGDQFTEINCEQDLKDRGFPKDIVGQCARLSVFRHVVVVIDSLDVLSLGRQHSALKVFLGLIDRLEKIKNVTVIAACRDFDLQYDPLLRGRTWSETIHIQPLDFETVVKPFLIVWDIDPSTLSTKLCKLLQIPQHLRIYEKLANLGKRLNPATDYELYNSFLEEVIVQNPLLGDRAITALQNMADHLVQKRSLSCSKVVFSDGEEIVRHLISQEVLWEKDEGVLAFSHQTLLDCLIVRSSIAKAKSLAEFILAHPPLHFIRPSVRAFFFYLRAYEPDIFRKQVWQVLDNNEIAYHFKRLVCESIAEIIPVQEDWQLLLRIFNQHPDLFRRFLEQIGQNTWFDFLSKEWLSAAKASEKREDWLHKFCWKLGIWVNDYPQEVISLWQEAINSEWINKQGLIWAISNGLDKFKAWNTKGVKELLQSLVKAEDIGTENHSPLGKVLSRWVQTVNYGDELLWQYITRSLSSDDISQRGIEHQLHCDSHDFHHPNFLEERLKQSDELLNIVLRSVEVWSNDHYANKYEVTRLKKGFLWNTSWRYKHNKHDYANDLNILIESLEKALKYRSLSNDEWWKVNEPQLRITSDAALRYLVIESYKENVQDNIVGIESQLQDDKLLNCCDLNYTLGELMKIAYPYISGSAQTNNQNIILELCSDPPFDMDESKRSSWISWKNRKIYDLLIQIPSVFRIEEAQSQISSWKNHFGYEQPSPHRYISSHIEISPISKEDFLKLSDESISRLLIGRFSEAWFLRESCSLKPIHFLGLLPHFVEDRLDRDYINAVIEGVANHLRHRFGNVSSADAWSPVQPLPDGKILAAMLLNSLERYLILWEDARTVSNALEACCDVLDDSESAERLTLFLFWIWSKFPDDENTLNNERDLISRAINSARGIAVISAMKLCNRLLENDQPLPELLPYLLHNFARDSAIYARVPILQHLPFLMYKLPSLGWQLLAEVFQEPQPNLWKYAERSLYHQYQSHFYKVAPYLERLMKEGMEEAGDVWGRISTLASLAGYISQEELFESLAKANTKAWKGSVQVFAANLNRREHREVCHSGLIYILKQENLSDEVIREIDQCFDKEANRGFIRHDLVSAFLNALSISAGSHDIFKFLEWLGREARYNPLFYLEIIETLVDKLERKLLSGQIWHTEPLIIALNEILREADESDDPKIIHRAINLQDHFLRLGINGIEEMIAKAEQS
jgi:hypothetical protein